MGMFLVKYMEHPNAVGTGVYGNERLGYVLADSESQAVEWGRKNCLHSDKSKICAEYVCNCNFVQDIRGKDRCASS